MLRSPALSTSTTGTRPHFERTDEMWSWRAGAVFQPTAAQMYYAYYGTSFNPSAEYLTLTAATADLDPEENETFEILEVNFPWPE